MSYPQGEFPQKRNAPFNVPPIQVTALGVAIVVILAIITFA